MTALDGKGEVVRRRWLPRARLAAAVDAGEGVAQEASRAEEARGGLEVEDLEKKLGGGER